ncbi:MAG TPA: hypothetical protein VED01_25200 [Burkholderiales bacterium]|nr:hypothetical protein [Burkholderiales bacterium]
MTSAPPSVLPHAQYERFESTREYEDMFDDLVARTQSVIRIFDRSLSARYNAPARCTLLREFLRSNPSNRLYIVLHEVESMARVCPRFVALLQHFSHVAKVRQTPRWARHVYDPFAIFDASHYLHRFHSDHMRYARGQNELTGAQQLLDRHAELWEASKPAAAASVLGL